jgi:hypothetical protein
MNRSCEDVLPEEDFVERDLSDLAEGRVTDFSLLVLVAAPRLRRLGIKVPEPGFPGPYEHKLYDRLEQRLGTAAHSYYSFARALEREQSQA